MAAWVKVFLFTHISGNKSNFFLALANNFALLDAEDNTSGLLHRGGITDIPWLTSISTQSFNVSFVFAGNFPKH